MVGYLLAHISGQTEIGCGCANLVDLSLITGGRQGRFGGVLVAARR
ncbi:hypothetical protein ACFXK0_06220 [Nocardia sp. NPDC059177]